MARRSPPDYPLKTLRDSIGEERRSTKAAQIGEWGLPCLRVKKQLTEPRKCQAIQYGFVVELSGSRKFALSMVGGQLDSSCFLDSELWSAGNAFKNGRLRRSDMQKHFRHTHVTIWARRQAEVSRETFLQSCTMVFSRKNWYH